MRVLVAGATGLIGRPLVQALLDRGDEVHYLTSNKNKYQALAGATGFYWQPERHQCPDEALAGVSVVINLAGASVSLPWTKKRKHQILQSRLDTAKTLELAIAERSETVKHYISASGISGYASTQSINYTDRDEILGSGFLADVVRQWEAAILPFEKMGLKTTAVRTGLVLAKNGGVLPKIAQPIRWGVGSVIGSGKQHQSWIHIDDLVAVYLWIIDQGQTRVINAVAPNAVSQKEMTRLMAKVMKRPLWLPPVPSGLLKLFLGERSALVMDSQWVIPEILIQEAFDLKFPDLQEALTDLLT